MLKFLKLNVSITTPYFVVYRKCYELQDVPLCFGRHLAYIRSRVKYFEGVRPRSFVYWITSGHFYYTTQ